MSQPAILPETIYHIYTHVNGFENLFRCDDNYQYFLNKYSHHIYPVAETYAYCLMPNHLHLMVQIRKESELLEFVRLKKQQPILQGFQTLGGFSNVISRQFSHLFNGYTQAYNKMYARKGSLFIPNFKRKEVNNDAYLTQLIGYIHNNPVHHGFVKIISDWPYSSYSAYLSEKPSKINRQYFTDWFGDQQAFMKFHKNIILSPELIID